eukprot:CAMPEP_0117443360 /NCGR_PEP_ID=MMETSP0759-20121206/4655_1 /TAXON_ID=63605 /ORGANISM="Percolomonas cosmopolitus, Strain WS" /LENGTH=128 /DNA_ID=CAMNT_0005235333 /DNA_START=335 /DNA_END=721 /DNA_ORIENTATION=+
MVMYLRNIVQLKRRKTNLPMIRVHDYDESTHKLKKVETERVKLPPITRKLPKLVPIAHTTEEEDQLHIANPNGYTPAQIDYIRNLSKAKKAQRAKRSEYVNEVYFTKKRKKLSRLQSKANVWSTWKGY